MLPTCSSYWKGWPQNKMMQITLELKPNAAVLGETERHECICGTKLSLICGSSCWAKLQSPLLGLGRRKQAQGWQLGKEEGGAQGIQRNNRGETKSKRQSKRKYVLKSEGNQSERNRCGQADKLMMAGEVIILIFKNKRVGGKGGASPPFR